ncbi:MAG TPA: cation:proton antiporter [Burkholderiales bacterium]|nr:cation:proton antiporter [Burkholderiales bacterium]
MTETWALASVWIALALAAALLSIYLRIANALGEILVGIAAGALIGSAALGSDTSWVKFVSGTAAVVLTFLAGAELDPAVFRAKWKEATAVGLVSFAAPFLACTAAAYYLLGWNLQASWLAGVAMSTTSVAVVYAVMLEFGLNRTDYGKTVLAACFITDLGTVLALGMLFAPFTYKTVIFGVATVALCMLLPRITPQFLRRFGERPSEIETKYLLLALFGLGALASWADSEPVLPAYVIGMVLAGSVGRNHALVRRLRTLTFGLLTPFYFLRAGSYVTLPALAAAPVVFLVLLGSKIVSKCIGVYPVARLYGSPNREAMYTTLLMSTGLTFGSISALFGLTHRIIDQAQYTLLILAVIASAIVPTLIANAFFLPRHLFPGPESLREAAERAPQAAHLLPYTDPRERK